MNHPWINVCTHVGTSADGVHFLCWCLFLQVLTPICMCFLLCRSPWLFPPPRSTPPASWLRTEQCGRMWRLEPHQHRPSLLKHLLYSTALQRYKSVWHIMKYGDGSFNINVINLRKQFSHNAVQGDLLSIHLSTISVFKCGLSHSKVRWCHSDGFGVYKDPLITQTCCYSAGLWSLFLLLQVPWEWREFRVE